MRITPTNACPSVILEGEDYDLKVRATSEVSNSEWASAEALR